MEWGSVASTKTWLSEEKFGASVEPRSRALGRVVVDLSQV